MADGSSDRALRRCNCEIPVADTVRDDGLFCGRCKKFVARHVLGEINAE